MWVLKLQLRNLNTKVLDYEDNKSFNIWQDMTKGHYRLVDGRVIGRSLQYTLSTLGKDRFYWAHMQQCHIPLLRESVPRQKWPCVTLNLTMEHEWKSLTLHYLQSSWTQFTTGAIRIPLFLRYHHQCPSSSPPPHLSCWLIRPHRGYRLSS